jgi:hypothetical protein
MARSLKVRTDDGREYAVELPQGTRARAVLQALAANDTHPLLTRTWVKTVHGEIVRVSSIQALYEFGDPDAA